MTDRKPQPIIRQHPDDMKTTSHNAEISAMLAARLPGLPAKFHAANAANLAVLGARANRNAENYCNIPDYGERFEREARRILARAAAIVSAYGLSVKHTGDPRGYCLRLFSADSGRPLKGNTWGGDDEGFGI